MSVYVLEDIGSRQNMEDRHCVEFNFYDKYDYFSIYDGHGGSDVSTWLQVFYKEILKSQLEKYSDPKISLIETARVIDRILPGDIKNTQGSTLLVIIKKNNTIWCCNIGDSRAIMNQNSNVIELSHDHKPDREDEKMRIETLGGSVIQDPWGTWRVNGYLALSRAIGDKNLFPFVISHPEITTHKIGDDNQFIIMASDGLWDVISNSQVIQIISQQIKKLDANDKLERQQKYPILRSLAIKLLNMARIRKSGDNITLLILLL